MTLEECFGIDPSSLADASNGAIEAASNPLINEEDPWIRFAFHNINGISLRKGLDVMPEISTICALQIDVAALTERNIYWNQSNRIKPSTNSTSTLGTQE